MYRLHGINDYASLAIHMALEELNTPFEFVHLDINNLGDPAFRAMNPLGLIPVMQTPQGPIFETAAILLYLAETHSAFAPAIGTQGRLRFLTWMIFTANSVHPTIMSLLHPYRTLGGGHDHAVTTEAHLRLLDQVAHLEASGAFDPDHPTVLSFYVAMLLRWAQAIAPIKAQALDLTRSPNILAMVQALERRPAIARVLAREGLAQTALSAPVYEGPDWA